MRFVKFHGYGNDYLVFEAAQLAGVASLNDFVRRVCDRHCGAGADGIAVLGQPNEAGADFSLRIFNHDGSEAAMSGNGSRCAAAYLHFRGLWSREELRLSTRAGVKLYAQRGRPAAGRYRFAAEIGRPRFESGAIPMLPAGGPLPNVRGYRLPLEAGGAVEVTALQMCNPNCCVFVEDFDRIDWRRVGRLVESHPQFPEHTNVLFVRVIDGETVEARVWERGVGETLSSGTGACSAAIAACVNDLTGRRVRVLMPGGELEVEWRGRDDEAVLTGEAEVVYGGEWLKEEGRGGVADAP